MKEEPTSHPISLMPALVWMATRSRSERVGKTEGERNP